MSDQPATEVTIAAIKRAVAARRGVGILEIDSLRRQRELCLARAVAMYLARSLTKKTFPTIGKAFGDRDHSCVIWATRKVERLLKTDRRLGLLIRSLTAELHADGALAFRNDPQVRAFDDSLAEIGFELAIVPIGSRNKSGFLKLKLEQAA